MLEVLEGRSNLSIEARTPRTSRAPQAVAISPADSAVERVWGRFQEGDPGAFETLYRKDERRIYAFALRLTQRPHEAADLVQGAFVKAWENRLRIESEVHMARWLRRVIVNDWINQLRRLKPVALPGDDETDSMAALPAPPERDSPLRLDLEQAIAALSPRLRAVFLLFDLHGHSHEEVADLLGITPGASKVQLHRARTRLKEALT